jgi:hypothetical protein
MLATVTAVAVAKTGMVARFTPGTGDRAVMEGPYSGRKEEVDIRVGVGLGTARTCTRGSREPAS